MEIFDDGNVGISPEELAKVFEKNDEFMVLLGSTKEKTLIFAYVMLDDVSPNFVTMLMKTYEVRPTLFDLEFVRTKVAQFSDKQLEQCKSFFCCNTDDTEYLIENIYFDAGVNAPMYKNNYYPEAIHSQEWMEDGDNFIFCEDVREDTIEPFTRVIDIADAKIFHLLFNMWCYDFKPIPVALSNKLAGAVNHFDEIAWIESRFKNSL